MLALLKPPAWALIGGVALYVAATADLSERLNEEYLGNLRSGSRPLRRAAKPVERSLEFQTLDVRCALHTHSSLSHDSRVTLAEVVAAAKTAGVRAVFLTDHPTEDRRWFTEAARGERDGVLLVQGVELSSGLLVWRDDGTRWSPRDRADEVLRKLQGTDAVTFIAHPEQRKEEADWELPGFHGMEIYNSHADASDSNYEKALGSLRSNPFTLFKTLGLLKKYQKEAFAAVFDEQVEVLKRWDQLNRRYARDGRKVVGIAANDSHQNVGIRIERGEGGLVIKDALGKVVGQLGGGAVLPLPGGGAVASYQMDPYEVSLGYVSTHLLAEKVEERALFDALLAGRAYVAFDWMADPSGFSFAAVNGDRSIPMGGDVAASTRPKLRARTNMDCELRLLRDGELVETLRGDTLERTVREPGVYRVEAWVQLGGEARPWIYSNPIYVR